ncbi:MAG: hypothetical protein EBY80_16765 [Actinobacteria bacterium]|nr:hypothetical protein [Actinomycetota bacterium]
MCLVWQSLRPAPRPRRQHRPPPRHWACRPPPRPRPSCRRPRRLPRMAVEPQLSPCRRHRALRRIHPSIKSCRSRIPHLHDWSTPGVRVVAARDGQSWPCCLVGRSYDCAESRTERHARVTARCNFSVPSMMPG